MCRTSHDVACAPDLVLRACGGQHLCASEARPHLRAHAGQAAMHAPHDRDRNMRFARVPAFVTLITSPTGTRDAVLPHSGKF